ncbi:Microcystin-dependent protein [Duganella sacchari]|uniref:Microcystin-dependent protein n=1 Tax=Duganella sacchari TaxID=551987 RepID=A0A1M7MBZ5_9BURK|nr:tail fiber protein [Duganella sacchari]SHM88246.1 Microcystin-dependent protein [Duganella sacchari]
MSDPFLGEIRIFAFNFAPKNWAFCNGRLLPINQNQALFALLGTTYGGDGRTTFALPDLRDRVPFSMGNGSAGSLVLGQVGGEAAHTVSANEMPQHSHTLYGRASLANTGDPTGALLGAKGRFGRDMLGVADGKTLAPNSVSTVGGSQSHENRQPFLALNFVIALAGIFPSQN